MNILQVLLPVLIMIGMGSVCRQTGFLSEKGIDDIKKLVTKVILPVAIFHALSTADYSWSTVLVMGIMLFVIISTFLLGFLLKPLMREPYKKYIPFMVSVYEGGMMAYPLYANLCGSQNLSNMAMLDIAGLLFGFSIYMGMLQQTENSTRISLRFLIVDALKNPTFIASLLGILSGLTGAVKWLLLTPVGNVYLDAEKLITAPLTAMILLAVGYSMKPDKKVLLPSLYTIGLRVLVQACLMVPALLMVRRWLPGNSLLIPAFVIYMSAPPTFSMQSFLKTEEAGTYAATTNSLYCIVSILVYGVMAAIL